MMDELDKSTDKTLPDLVFLQWAENEWCGRYNWARMTQTVDRFGYITLEPWSDERVEKWEQEQNEQG